MRSSTTPSPRPGPDPFGSLRPLVRAVRVRLLLHRRWLAACCLALAAWSALDALRPSPEPGIAVTVAAADLPSGTVLAPAHLRTARFLPASVPDSLPADVLGRTLAAPVTRGEPLTTARVVSPGFVAHLDGRTGVPVRVGDPDVVGLLDVGDRIDLVASDPRAGSHERVARQAVVLALPVRDDASTGLTGRLVLVAVTAAEAASIAASTGAEIQVHWSTPAPR